MEKSANPVLLVTTLSDRIRWQMLSLIRRTSQLTVAMCRRIAQRPAEAFFLCQLAWWVAVMSVAARCCSLPRALQILSAPTSPSTLEFDKAAQEQLARSVDLVLSADVFAFRPNCWKRAAVLHRFLSLRGISTRICFGVKTERAGKIKGHAWLEADGKPILEKEPPDYVITYTFPSNDSFKVSTIAFSHE
jgi:hypothetical protein